MCFIPNCVICLNGLPTDFNYTWYVFYIFFFFTNNFKRPQVLHLVLFALSESSKLNQVNSERTYTKKYYHTKDICDCVSLHWNILCPTKKRMFLFIIIIIICTFSSYYQLLRNYCMEKDSTGQFVSEFPKWALQA